MNPSTLVRSFSLIFILISGSVNASGMVPETSVVIVEQGDGEGAINVKNTDAFPVMLLTTLEDIPEDKDHLLIVTPPAARVEPGKSQRVRFILTSQIPLKTERLKRVIFEGIPPQQKGKNEVRMTVRQNLPVLIRPAGLAQDPTPWKRLTWKRQESNLLVSNTSPYVVRLGRYVQTRPDNVIWELPATYVLPGQKIKLSPKKGSPKLGVSTHVRISPATTWGYTVKIYDAPLAK
ncbi:fimbria/pilus chaperone family protein [Serratia quinivorans]|uniref:fimbria/pilus chaperone family protein n=1 Tax=Serratia quinivorans TaxID=137545 RepID=UPI0034C5CF61